MPQTTEGKDSANVTSIFLLRIAVNQGLLMVISKETKFNAGGGEGYGNFVTVEGR